MFFLLLFPWLWQSYFFSFFNCILCSTLFYRPLLLASFIHLHARRLAVRLLACKASVSFPCHVRSRRACAVK